MQMSNGLMMSVACKYRFLLFSLLLLGRLSLAADGPALCVLGLHDSARDLEARDGWLRDASGRYVLLRGVNFGPRAKLPPYLPIVPGQNEDARSQLVRLRCLGMNVVRLPIMWKALEPFPNPNLDELTPEAIAYLSRLKALLSG